MPNKQFLKNFVKHQLFELDNRQQSVLFSAKQAQNTETSGPLQPEVFYAGRYVSRIGLSSLSRPRSRIFDQDSIEEVLFLSGSLLSLAGKNTGNSGKNSQPEEKIGKNKGVVTVLAHVSG
ncbi:Hypothetical protein NTJ_06693 [Nesidiocoris tenuis]|uniref:Uncharacterized protein n=1 Tax=Nesidiocoris tenuis TaxID=355587 RepID=A0ABN7ARG8_9HEMI|nr:Hypothetical protein NTJ_06693 [Nesidiocoris tenuis]